MIPSLLAAASLLLPQPVIREAFGGRTGALVLIDCSSGEVQRYGGALCTKPLPPCSTFKIWNTAIGLESGILTDADQAFYKWDGQTRAIGGWNQDLTLRQAYAVSCVPAYQALATRIGRIRMQEWLAKLAYGNQDMSSGVDVFWLPAPDRTPVLISAEEQAALLERLARGNLPFSRHTSGVLREVMTAMTTERGAMFGKTGSGGEGRKTPPVGWFVGYLETGGRTLAFACLLTGAGASGKEARAVVEKIFSVQGLL